MAKEPSSFFQKLQGILASGNYTALEPFKDPASWRTLEHPEKEVLGQLFIKRGEELVHNGIPAGVDLLERAIKIAPNSFAILVSAGHGFASQDQNAGSLSSALRAYQAALEINPNAFEVSLAYLKALLAKGKLLDEVGYYNQVIQECDQLHSTALLQPKPLQAQFFACWGRALFLVGQIYGEAIDYNLACEKFREAEDKGLQTPEFFKECGDAYLELARLLGRENFCLEAIEFYQKSIKSSHECTDCWHSLGLCYTMLFENFSSVHHYNLADISFSNASKIDPNHPSLWVTWGLLHLGFGKQFEDVQSLEKSIEKFAKADTLEASQAWILCSWGEALLLKGSLTDQVSCLKEAERKFALSVSLQPDNDLIWQLYGCCFNELGRYFNAESYFQEAINKFQHRKR